MQVLSPAAKHFGKQPRLAVLWFICTASLLPAPRVTADGTSADAGPRGTPERAVYLLGGHSNIAGRDREHADTTPHHRAWAYRWWSDKRWHPAVDDGQVLTHRGKGGPAMALLKRLIAVREWRDLHFGVIQNAESRGTARWQSDTNGDGKRYMQGKRLFEELVGAANEVQPNAAIAGIVLHLGFLEASSAGASQNFARDFRQTVRELRTAVDAPMAPVFLLKYEADSRGGRNSEHSATLLEQAHAAASDELRIAYVDLPLTAADYMDAHHFSMSGHTKVIDRLVHLMLAKNWGPRPVAQDSSGDPDAGERPPAEHLISDRAGCVISAPSDTQSRSRINWVLLAILATMLAYRVQRAE